MSDRTSATPGTSDTARPRPHRHDDLVDDPGRGMKLSLLSIDNHGLIHARAAGSITAHDFLVADGKEPFEQLLGVNWKASRVLFDFAHVTHIDSRAIGWLIGARRAFREGGGCLVLHSVQPNVQQIFDVLKLGRVIPMADNAAAAREMATGATTTTTETGGAR